jgi:hypothetical protein
VPAALKVKWSLPMFGVTIDPLCGPAVGNWM